MDAVFSEFNLDSDEVVSDPEGARLQLPPAARLRPARTPERMGVDERDGASSTASSEALHRAAWACRSINTCTPYQVGNVPTRGEHCAWMESSAVVYCNSVLGARTNTEGPREHRRGDADRPHPVLGLPPRREPPRHAPRASSTSPVEIDRRLGPARLLDRRLGAGARAGGRRGDRAQVPNLPRLKHFGAAASSSGGVEMYHLVGVTPEAPTLEAGLRRQRAGARRCRYGAARARADLRAHQRDRAATREVDYVMLGCPHYTHRADLGGRAAARRPQGARRTASCGSSRRARSRRWPTATATPQIIEDAGAHADDRQLLGDEPRRAARAPRWSRSTRPSRRTTCRRSWACRPGSAPRRECIDAACTGALARSARHERRTDARSCCTAARSSAASPRARRWSRTSASRAGAASTRAPAPSIETRHELRGQSASPARCWCSRAPRARRAGRPCSTWRALLGTAPAAMLFNEMTHQDRARRGGDATRRR